MEKEPVMTKKISEAGRPSGWRSRESLLMLVYELVLREMYKLKTKQIKKACEELLMTDYKKIVRSLEKVTRKKDSPTPWEEILNIYEKGDRENIHVCTIAKMIDQYKSALDLDANEALKKILLSKNNVPRIVVKSPDYKGGKIVIMDVKTLRGSFYAALNALNSPEKYPHLYQRARILEVSLKSRTRRPGV